MKILSRETVPPSSGEAALQSIFYEKSLFPFFTETDRIFSVYQEEASFLYREEAGSFHAGSTRKLQQGFLKILYKFHSLCHKISDFIEFLIVDQILFYHPASAACNDIRMAQILSDI